MSRHLVAAAALALSLFVAGCDDDDDPTARTEHGGVHTRGHSREGRAGKPDIREHRSEVQTRWTDVNPYWTAALENAASDQGEM